MEDFQHRLADIRSVGFLKYGCMEVLVTTIKLSLYHFFRLALQRYCVYICISVFGRKGK